MPETYRYTALAAIYDHVMDHVDYQKWAEYIFDLFEFAQVKVEKILDISCGTGELLRYMFPQKYKIIASDKSLDMLMILKKKKVFNKVPVFTADSVSIPLTAGRIDAALMLYDSINYHTEPNDLALSLREINRILKPGGLFIFDTVTRWHCKTYFHHEFEEQFWGNKGYTLRSRFDTRENLQYNEFDINIAGRSYHEIHVQRIYGINELRKIVEKMQLKVLAIFDEFTFNKATKRSQRIHFVCRKL